MAKFIVILLCLVITKSHLILAMPEAPPPTAAPRKVGRQAPAEFPAASRLSSGEAPAAVADGGSEVSATGEETAPVGQEEEMRTDHRRRRSAAYKSVAGGGVIVGGLATTFLVAVFCYIRATRRKAEPGSPTNSNSDPSVGRRGEAAASPV